VVFWLPLFEIKSLTCFKNSKKYKQKNSSVHLQILHAHKVVSQKIDLSFVQCKKEEFGAKSKVFCETCFMFSHQPHKILISRNLIFCKDVHTNFLLEYFNN
jgi:hypothetical protein